MCQVNLHALASAPIRMTVSVSNTDGDFEFTKLTPVGS